MSRPLARLRAAGAAAVLLAAGFVAVVLAGPAQAASTAQVIRPDVGTSRPLTELARAARPAKTAAVPAERGPVVSDTGHDPDGALDQLRPGIAAIPNATTFRGLTGGPVQPPDPVGDIGPNHYVEMVNLSVGVFKRNGTNILNVSIGSIFAGLPGTHPVKATSATPSYCTTRSPTGGC